MAWYNERMRNHTVINRKNRMMKSNITATTSGRGLWTGERKTVTISNIKFLPVIYDESGPSTGAMYVEAQFDKSDWNIDEDGLIYTDQKWLREFREGFYAQFPELREIDGRIDYTEQGMQGEDHVSLILVVDNKHFQKYLDFLRKHDLMSAVETY